MPAITEFDIQRALVLWLDGTPTKSPALVADAIYWHTPNGGSRRDAFEGKRLKQIGLKAGIFDLTFVRDGRFWVLELKDATGRLSGSQTAMWGRYQRAGASGIAVVNNLADAKSTVVSWGLAIIS